VLIPDGRVTNEGLKGLLDSTNCKVWLYAADDAGGPLVGPGSGLKICALPSLTWMLDSEEQPRYPYDKIFDEAKWDEMLIIHTSGTTGKHTQNSCSRRVLIYLRRAEADFPHQWDVGRSKKRVCSRT
jgi:hypothetical protein